MFDLAANQINNLDWQLFVKKAPKIGCFWLFLKALLITDRYTPSLKKQVIDWQKHKFAGKFSQLTQKLKKKMFVMKFPIIAYLASQNYRNVGGVFSSPIALQLLFHFHIFKVQPTDPPNFFHERVNKYFFLGLQTTGQSKQNTEMAPKAN